MKNRNVTSTILLALGFLALSPIGQAVVPAPDGGYPNFTTAEGQNALKNLSTGQGNTAVGWFSLFSDTTGSFNTGVGAGTLPLNTGDQNTAVGTGALFLNATGCCNTANGGFALFSNTTGMLNTANGVGALQSNTIGNDNTANGVNALLNNTTGGGNTADGRSALQNNTTGGGNIALGGGAGSNLTTGNNNIDIGNLGAAGESNTIRIGQPALQTAVFIVGISGTPVTGTAVVVNSSGQLGVAPSSQHFKDEIKSMNETSEVLFALKPVRFRYKKDFDPSGTAQFGLVAEEVEKVNPDLVVRDKEGKPYTVRYDQVNAMLLNEFLKEHERVEEQGCKLESQGDVIQVQQAAIARLQSTVVQQQKSFQSQLAKQENQMEALRSGLEKVSAQLELSKSRPQTVLNNQ